MEIEVLYEIEYILPLGDKDTLFGICNLNPKEDLTSHDVDYESGERQHTQRHDLVSLTLGEKKERRITYV
ncbi:hypothetical protein CR513_37483, partial [Mucuna pruriens]